MMNEKPIENVVAEVAARLAKHRYQSELAEKQLNLVGPLTGKPPGPWQGPLRRTPEYYAGTHIGRKDILHIETPVRVIKRGTGFTQKREVRVGGKRDKAARRMIRGKLKKKLSNIEAGVHNAHMMRAEAALWGDSPGERRRLYEEGIERARAAKKEDK